MYEGRVYPCPIVTVGIEVQPSQKKNKLKFLQNKSDKGFKASINRSGKEGEKRKRPGDVLKAHNHYSSFGKKAEQ